MRGLANDELGIGIAYDSTASPRASSAGYNFVEVAPRAEGAGLPRADAACGRVVLKSSRLAVGGSCDADPAVLTLLGENIVLRRPSYVVVELGFNRFSAGAGSRATGFVLPAPRTPDGVAVAVRNIVALRERFGTAIAFEFGANDLPARADDLSDAAFYAAIATNADCGIVIDLASVCADQASGRGFAAMLIDGLPGERVWEVRVPSAASVEMRRLAERIVPRLPALRALVYDVRPESLHGLGARALGEQREWLARLWKIRGTTATGPTDASALELPGYDDARVRVAAWERNIACRLAGAPSQSDENSAAFTRLAARVAAARKAAIAEGAELSLRLLEATLGRTAFSDLLKRYCEQTCAEIFPATEALHFLQFVERERTDVPYLREVVAFERAATQALQGACETAIYFPCEPTEIFRALLRHDRPYVSDRRPHIVHVGPRGLRIESDYRHAG